MGRGGLGLLLFILAPVAIVGAAAGMITWWLIKALWFVLGVAPFRIAAGIREGVYNNRLGRAEERMEQYLSD
jgi:hypothetical protein